MLLRALRVANEFLDTLPEEELYANDKVCLSSGVECGFFGISYTCRATCRSQTGLTTVSLWPGQHSTLRIKLAKARYMLFRLLKLAISALKKLPSHAADSCDARKSDS